VGKSLPERATVTCFFAIIAKRFSNGSSERNKSVAHFFFGDIHLPSQNQTYAHWYYVHAFLIRS
jgi:hypothetical protein